MNTGQYLFVPTSESVSNSIYVFDWIGKQGFQWERDKGLYGNKCKGWEVERKVYNIVLWAIDCL